MQSYVGEQKSPGGGPSEIFIAMGGFLGGEGPLFGTFQGGAAPPWPPPVLTYVGDFLQVQHLPVCMD